MGFLAGCELLLAAHADLFARDACSWTPLHLAAKHGQEPVCEWLLGNGAVDSLDDAGVRDTTRTPQNQALRFSQLFTVIQALACVLRRCR